MENEQITQRINALIRELRNDGFSSALVAVSFPSPTCRCGKPDCSGAIGLGFDGNRGAMLQIIQRLLTQSLSPDDLAAYARQMLEFAYSKQVEPQHRMRTREQIH
jgi:hypothetical protein